MISVTAEQAVPDGWRFAVTDNGIGIDPRHFDRVFQMFQRLNPTSETDGTGIGLTICRHIVQRFGGKIWLESTPDAGSTFFFTLLDGVQKEGEAGATRPSLENDAERYFHPDS